MITFLVGCAVGAVVTFFGRKLVLTGMKRLDAHFDDRDY